MTLVRLLMAALVLAGAGLAAAPPAHAQIFGQIFGEPRYAPPRYNVPPQRRLPGGDDYRPRRQYVPEQRARPQRRGFFERLFGGERERPPRREQERRSAPPASAGGGGGGGGGGGDTETAAPARKAVPKTVFVALIGDSMAENLAPGLTDALSERPEVGIVREIRPGIGFLKEVKEDQKTWRMVVDEVLARDPAVAAAVIFLNPHDDPPKSKKKKKGEEAELQAARPALQAAPWMDQYAAKVDDIALAFRQKGIPLLWVGLPPVEDEKTTADHLFLNDLVRQRVTALGGTFVDVWEGFVNEDEEFTVQGPNIEGRVVRLRTSDGVHFTRAGARKIGHSVELELRSYLVSPDSGEAMTDLSVDPGAPTTPGSSRILILGQAPRTPGALLAPGGDKPAAEADGKEKVAGFDPGVIAAPEGPASAPDASGAAGSDNDPKRQESALISGTPVPPKPGRADDFSWADPAGN